MFLDVNIILISEYDNAVLKYPIIAFRKNKPANKIKLLSKEEEKEEAKDSTS